VCAGFAVLGIVPLGLGVLTRLPSVQRWTAEETTALIQRELGIRADYHLRLRPWPLEITMTDVVVHASDGGSPFLSAREIVARPRVFTLLAGKLDLGEVHIEEPRVRAVVRDGELENLTYRRPEPRQPSEQPSDYPLSAVAVTHGQIDLVVEDLGLGVRARELDLDLWLDRRGPVELSLRAGPTAVDRVHAMPGKPELLSVDEDMLCRLDLRARLDDDQLVVRRLRLLGSVDFDPDRGTRPGCRLAEEDWRKLKLRLESVRAELADGALASLEGRMWARLPAAVVHRFAPVAPVAGNLIVDLTTRYQPSMRLPSLTGRVGGRDLGIDGKVLAKLLMADVDSSGDRVRLSDVNLGWAGGTAAIGQVLIDPFASGATLEATDIDIRGVDFPDMLHDLGAHPRAHVAWTIERATLPRFGGTLDPLELAGPIHCATRDFAVYDRPSVAPDGYRFIGIDRATVDGTFRVTPDAVVLSDMALGLPRSQLRTSVSLGFDEQLAFEVAQGSSINLGDISPLVGIPMSGVLELQAHAAGSFNKPLIEGELSIANFVFGGFPLGHVEQSRVRFVPLAAELGDAKLRKGRSAVSVPRMKIDFDAGADVVLQADVDTRTSAGLWLPDLFEMVRFDEDPRFGGIEAVARGVARVDYVLGGPRDRCGGGRLKVGGRMDLSDALLFGERFDSGYLDMDFAWEDMPAGIHGLSMELRSGVLRKGPGTFLARGKVDRGTLRADATATGIPLSELSAFESLFASPGETDNGGEKGAAPKGAASNKAALAGLAVRPEATISAVAAVGGSLDRPEVQADIDISPLRIGPDILPASRLRMFVQPTAAPEPAAGTTRCGNPRSAPFDLQRWQGDPVAGVVRLAGTLFGGQVRFDDLQITQQRAAIASGELALRSLDLGALANLLPGVAFSSSPPSGTLDANVLVEELPLAEPALAEIAITLGQLEVERWGHRLRIPETPGDLERSEPVRLSGDVLYLPEMSVLATHDSGLELRLRAGGSIAELSGAQRLALGLRLDPTDLSELGLQMPAVASAAGVVRVRLGVGGTVKAPNLRGDLTLKKGALSLKGFPVPFENIELRVGISPGEIRVLEARARAGTGRIWLSDARVPLRGLELTGATATLEARNVSLPVADGVQLTADATLNASYEAPPEGVEQSAPPHVTGNVSLTSFSYTRPISFQLDIDQLTGRSPTEVETYNPADDVVTFDLNLVSPAPLEIANNMLDMQIAVPPPGLRLMGTNQQFGALGTLSVESGSTLFLLGHHFSVRDGTILFDSTTRIAPRLDIHATTEYRRYASSSPIEPAAATAAEAAAGSTAGKWRIAMVVTGDTDEPKIRFTSDPPLSQEDIILLLQVGMTRAELDRGMVGSLAQSVGLEALTQATGFDQAVRSTVPLIDEFRVGSQYSSRTGRTEPTATVGKRITDDIRATVTTGLTDNREVRSNVEWQLSRGISLEGSYDNVNDVASSSIGNLGADIRWRLQFD